MCNHRSIKYTRHIRISIHYISTFRSSFTLCLSACLSIIVIHTLTQFMWVCVRALLLQLIHFPPFNWQFLSLFLYLFLSLSLSLSLPSFYPLCQSVSFFSTLSLMHSSTFLPVYCCYSSYISALTFYQFLR